MLKTQGNITMALHFLELTLNIRSVRKFLLFGENYESESDAPSALQCKDATGQVMPLHGCIDAVQFLQCSYALLQYVMYYRDAVNGCSAVIHVVSLASTGQYPGGC